MQKYRTLLIAAAAALLAASPAAAKPVVMEIGTYSIDTARSETSIEKLLAEQGFSLPDSCVGAVFVNGVPNCIGGRIVDGIDKNADALKLFRRLAAPSAESSAKLLTVSGRAVPVSVGEKFDYVKSVEMTTDEKGKKHVVRHLGEVESGLSVSLSPTVRKGGVVHVKVDSELKRIQLKDYRVGGELIQLLHGRSFSVRGAAKLRADQAVVYVHYVPAERRTLFKTGEVRVTVVKAKVAK